MKMRQLTGWHRWMGVMLIFLGLSGAAWAAEDEDPEPTPEQIEATRQAAKKGNAEAQYALGTCYMMGKGVTRDKEEAVHWWTQAARQGHVQAQNDLGGYCLYTKRGRDAAQWFLKAADQGHVTAQYNLGKCFYSGQGVAKDRGNAVYWWRKAAEQGYAPAQYRLGRCFHEGEGVKENAAEAVKWYRAAAEQGYADAQFYLGSCYVTGEGVEKDRKMAETWLRAAAGQEHIESTFTLGVCLSRWNPKSPEGISLIRKAAEQGLPQAQSWLGRCYAEGRGVPKDNKLAIRWWKAAADQGDERAITELIKRGFSK